MHKKCRFCKEFRKGVFRINKQDLYDRTVYDSGNFVAFPSLGQFTGGYLLITPKGHYVSVGELPNELYGELENSTQKIKKALYDEYSSPTIIFEHGLSQKSLSGCIEHAHLHIMPAKADIFEDLAGRFAYRRINNFLELKEKTDDGLPYYFYENNLGERFVFDVPMQLPSQHLRQIVAAKIGIYELWNWNSNFELGKMRETYERLKDKI